jgi:hypothetical protein
VSDRERQALTVLQAARVEDQLENYYGRTAAEYARASAQSVAASAVLLSLTTLAGTLAGLDIAGKGGWAIAAAILPALATALAAYDALFGFERVSKLFFDAIRSLRRIEAPDLTQIADDAEAATAVAAYAEAIEAVLAKEQAQWGQLTAEIELPGQSKQH